MAELSPEEMAAMQDEAGKKGPDLVALTKQTAQGLQQLAEALNRSPQATPDEKDQMAQILSGYMDLVEKKLGQEAGGEQEPETEAPVPMEAGTKGVPLNMKMRS
jgi:hypothetical protein